MSDEKFDKAIDAYVRSFPTVTELSSILPGNEDALEAETYDLKHEQAKDMANDRDLRNKYSRRLFIYMCCWTTFVGVVTLLQGFGLQGFKLDGSVVSVLYGTTTVSVLGLMLAIVQGLFPKKKE